MSNISSTDKIDTIEIELAPSQRDALDKLVDLTGKDPGDIAQLIFDHGLESWDSLARLIDPE